MTSGGPTKREIEASVQDFLNPEPMTIEDALASEQPAVEIGRRLGVSPEQPMTDVEETYWVAFYFLGDSLNGGIDQALSNSTGDAFDSVMEFTKLHCDPRITSVLAQVAALFPNSVVPTDRVTRNAALDALPENGEDLFEQINSEFYELEDRYITGLIAFATENKSEFKNLGYASRDA